MRPKNTSAASGQGDRLPGVDTGTLRARLEALWAAINREVRRYPTPIAGCDQQFNHLLDMRLQVSRALRRLESGSGEVDLDDAFIAEIEAFIASTRRQPAAAR